MNRTDKEGILKILMEGRMVSGEEIAQSFGVTRQAVSSAIGALKDEGVPIRSEHHRGYVLTGEPHTFSPSWAQVMLRGTKWRMSYYGSTSSTQDVAKAEAARGAAPYLVVVCGTQESGRGRRGRDWASPPGCGLFMSVLLRPNIAPACAAMINLAAAMAVRCAIFETCGIEAQVKWPNDLLIGGRKICGILSEAAMDMETLHYVVCGMGINVNGTREDYPPQLHNLISTLQEENGEPVRMCVIFRNLLMSTERWVGELKRSPENLIVQYARVCDTVGKDVRVESGGDNTTEGRAIGISPQGGLIVEESSGKIHTWAAADVHHVRRKDVSS